jgi:tetratricopeptide (TPR) repeat protein
LEILDKLTDLDHVNDNAGELIAVLCRFDVKLAARAAKFLRDRLSPYMWRTSIRKALEQAGLDVAKIGSELIKVESTLSLGAGRSKKVEEHSPEHAMSFEEAATALTKHHKFTLDANYRLRQQLVDLCADKGQIEKAAAILTDAGDLARLALRAHALKEDALARQYSQRSVHDGKPLLGWNWDWDQSEALDLLCKLDSTRAAPIFQEAVLASMEEPYYLGHVSQAVICMCLMSLGLVEEAKSLFQEFLGFLREITKVYPSMENELERDWA